MSNFFGVMGDYGYSLRNQEPHRYIFEKDLGHNRMVIIFNTQDKYINGCLIPLRTITHKQCVVELYTAWKQLENEIKCLASKAKYNIIMKVEED